MRSNMLMLLAAGLLALAGCRSQGYYDSQVYGAQPPPNVRTPTVPTPEDQEEEEAEEARREAEEAKREAEQARREAEEARREAERLQRELDAAKDSGNDNEPPEQGDEQRPQNPPPADPSAEVTAALAGLRSDPLEESPVVVPKYLLPADVTIRGVAFARPRGASVGRWYTTTLSNRGAISQDDMLVYSDNRRLSVPIMDAHSDFALTTSGDYLTLTIDPASHVEFLGSTRFPRVEGTIQIPLTVDGLPDDSMDKADRTAWFSASFDGAAGDLQCVDVIDGTCSVQLTSTGYVLNGNTWMFRTATTAQVHRPDPSYMYFGWWRKQTIADGVVKYRVFGETGMDASTMHFPGLTGTAAYIGPAIGQYAIHQSGGMSDYGSFKGTVQLSADFNHDTISGVITGFDVNTDWTVTLKLTNMAAGTIAEGDVSWTIGRSTEDGGNWNGAFHHETAPVAGAKPDGIAGTFDARYGNAGRMVGAFGAKR